MEYIISFVNSLLDGPVQAKYLFLISISIAVFIVVVLLLLLVSSYTNPVEKKINQLGVVRNKPAKKHYYTKLLNSISPFVLPKAGKETSKIKQRLIHAGYRKENASIIYFASKLGLGIAFLIIVLMLARLNPVYTTNHVIFAALLSAFIAMQVPAVILSKIHQKRVNELKKGFSDALDLMVVCVEAGLGLDAAIQRVSEELEASHEVLAAELKIVNDEIRAGIERTSALQNLAKRTGINEVKSLIALLTQSLKLGSSVGKTLRVYADDFRDKQMQRAEEKAAMIGTKLIFPLVLCIFPAFFVISVGPAVLGVIEKFK